MTQALAPIRSAEDHQRALAQAQALMGAAPGSPEANQLAVLSVLIADYERRAGMAVKADPIDVIELEMKTRGRSQAELARVLGSRSRASEVLSRQRALNGVMADRVAKAWNIPRALLGPPTAGSDVLKRRLQNAAGAAAIALSLSVGAVAAGGAWALHDLPDTEQLVQTANGADFVPLTKIPLQVRQAFLAAEDGDFYRHDGASFRAIMRASADTAGNLLRGEGPSGGATITQQLVKNTLLAGEGKTLRRKVREIVLARELEASLSKDRILELYLNVLYMGKEAKGVAQAARFYFGVDVEHLTIAQAAALAAMPKAPNLIRPDRPANQERAMERRNWVLDRMGSEGYVTYAALDAARKEPLR
jgi:penicillin-binding protein 1A